MKTGRPRLANNTRKLDIVISQETYNKLTKIVNSQGRTVSDFVRWIISKEVEKHVEEVENPVKER